MNVTNVTSGTTITNVTESGIFGNETTVYDAGEDYPIATCIDWGTGDLESWIVEVVRLFLSTAILLCNTFIVVSVLRFWTRDCCPVSGRAASTLLVLNLAAADALMGLALVYAWFQDTVCSFYQEMAKNPLSCLFPHVMIQFFDSASAVTIIIIAVDRVMSVSHTARFRNFLTTRRTHGLIAAVWIAAIFLALTVFIFPDAYQWNNGGCDLAPTYDDVMFWGTVAIILFSLILCYLRIHTVTLQMMQRGSVPPPRKQMGTKASRMLLMIIAWDTCAYFPLFVVTLIKSSDKSVNSVVEGLTRNLTLLTFLADPFIYAYNNQQTKKAIADFLSCLRGEDSSQSAETFSGRRVSLEGTSMQKVRQIISTLTVSSSGSDDDKESRNSPSQKRSSRIVY